MVSPVRSLSHSGILFLFVVWQQVLVTAPAMVSGASNVKCTRFVHLGWVLDLTCQDRSPSSLMKKTRISSTMITDLVFKAATQSLVVPHEAKMALQPQCRLHLLVPSLWTMWQMTCGTGGVRKDKLIVDEAEQFDDVVGFLDEEQTPKIHAERAERNRCQAM